MLWSVVMLSTIAATMTASGRSDVQLARNLRSAAAAEAAADGAIHLATFHLLDPEQPWPADGRMIAADRNGLRIGLCITNEAGKINPNTAGPGLMDALLRTIGVDATTAQRLAAAIYEWRTGGDANGAKLAPYRAAGLPYGPAGAPFGSVAELRLVLGMTDTLWQRLSPFMTVFSDADPDPSVASPVVLAAMRTLVGFDPPAPAPGVAPRTVAITTQAQTRDGARFTRRAVVRLAANPDQPQVRVLTWEKTRLPDDCR